MEGARQVLEALEQASARRRYEAMLPAQLAFLARQHVPIDDDELAGATRRALFVLAAGGDPHRELDPDGQAVATLAADLDTPDRRRAYSSALAALHAESRDLPRVAHMLEEMLGNGPDAWRWLACALLAEQLAEDA